MVIVKCRAMLVICIMWIVTAIMFSFCIKILSVLALIIIWLCLLAAYDSYKRYKCYLILNEKYISINVGVINGFNTIHLEEIEYIRITNNKVYISFFENKKILIFLNLFDEENRNIMLEYISNI